MSAAEKLYGPILRPMRESDRAFILNSWLKSYWEGWWRYFKEVSPKDYWEGQWLWINRFLEREGSRVLIAAVPEDDDVITAWVAYEETSAGPVCHYVYVKEAFREQGMMALLLETVSPRAVVYTHVTRRALFMLERLPRASYNPWLLSR